MSAELKEKIAEAARSFTTRVLPTAHHYYVERRGPVHTACGLGFYDLRQPASLTSKLKEVDCPACLRSDECKAQAMEEALQAPAATLVDETGSVYRVWAAGERIEEFTVYNESFANRKYMVKRADGFIILQFTLPPGQHMKWNPSAQRQLLIGTT